ncbi:MAG: copper resistance protein CopC [Actinomycetota bacterium]|nr:copper resistance protein CopC [Actinomycetota bacterium]
MPRTKISLAAVALMCLLWAPAWADHGGPHMVSSDPEEGAKAHSVDEVSVTFDELLDPDPESYDLDVEVCGENATEGSPQLQEDGRTISVAVSGDDPGTYVVEYRVSGLDETTEEETEPTEGSYRFSLHYTGCDRDKGNDNNHKNHNNGGKDKNGHGKHSDHRGSNDNGRHRSDHDGHTGGADPTHDDHSSSDRGHSDHSSSSTHDKDDHEKKAHRDGRHRDHKDKKSRHGQHGKRGKHGGGHSKDEEGGGPTAGPNRPSRPNDVLNLALVLLIPALVGAVGGRALRARTPASAS